MNIPLRTFAVLAVPFALAGCVTMGTVTQTRASNDFNCPEEKVAVKNVGGTSFQASGCGQKAVYNCAQADQNGHIVCVRE